LKKWRIIGLATATVLLVAYVATGMHYASYAPHRSGNYLWGAYHVHSTMSDGLQTPEEIARQARAEGTSFVILTEHGRPNLQSSMFRESIDGVTMVGGSEASLPEGHFTFFGASATPGYQVSSFPPEAMEDARGWGAFPVLAYPQDPRYGWQYWEADLKPGGIEVLNLFTSLRGTSFAEKFLLAIYYPFSRYYFLKSISFPAESMAHWDDFLRRNKTWGLVASDAHGGFHVAKWFAIKVPSYADTFSLVGIGISKRYELDPEAGVRAGDFFNCVRGAGEPERFEFFAGHEGVDYPSGSDAPADSDLHVEVKAVGQLRLVLKKDGETIREVAGDNLSLDGAKAGVYRVEVYLVRHPLLAADVPWILSNPIFVGVKRESLPARNSKTIRAQLVKHAEFYKR
jgi:hypothetical protein